MLCRARSRLSFAATSLRSSRLLQARPAIISHRALFQPRAASDSARPTQSAIYFSLWNHPRIDLSSPPPKTAYLYFRAGAHRTTVDPAPPGKEAEATSKAALTFESPLWLAIASGCKSHRELRTPVINMAKIRGIHSGGIERAGATDDLEAVMTQIDPRTEILHIANDVPTSDQWEALGRYFTTTRDAAAELVTTPAILEGKIKHLVLFFANGLRFEGPTTKELMKDAEPIFVIPRKPKALDAGHLHAAQPASAETTISHPEQSEARADTPTAEGEEEPKDIEVFSVPDEWRKWLNAKYFNNPEIVFSADPPEGSKPSAMKKLDILGNDALQMFSCIALANFHLLISLDSLTLYSTSDNDLTHVFPAVFLAVFPGLLGPKELKLTLGSPVYATLLAASGDKPFLHSILPISIEVLHFRGPVNMAAHMDEFAAAFGNNKFLPLLKQVSFVLDLPDKSSDSPKEATVEQLRTAHAACRKVLDAAAARGVAVEEFREPWVEEHSLLFKEVDGRWPVVDVTAGARLSADGLLNAPFL